MAWKRHIVRRNLVVTQLKFFGHLILCSWSGWSNCSALYLQRLSPIWLKFFIPTKRCYWTESVECSYYTFLSYLYCSKSPFPSVFLLLVLKEDMQVTSALFWAGIERPSHYWMALISVFYLKIIYTIIGLHKNRRFSERSLCKCIWLFEQGTWSTVDSLS